MGSVRIFVLFAFIRTLSRVNSQDCFSAKLAETDTLEIVQIYNNEFALENDHVSYEIAPSAPSNSFDQVSDPIRFLTNNQSACPETCLITLNRYTDTFQGNESTILFFDTDHAFYLPSHYVKDNITTLVCVSTNGYCGATVPVYRYYRISNGGVFHAYSFEQDIVYDGYNQEFMPICYAWPMASGTVASRPTCGTLNFDTPLSALADLNVYDNYKDGIERDHYYTTLPLTDPSIASAGYNQSGVLGKVLTSPKSTACSCLVKLQQVFDNQTGYFHRRDHKLIVTGQEPNRPYEEYVDTGEAVYCAKRLGDCGASVPLWKHFQFYDIDSVYTTDSAPLPMTYLYPQVPLCYIWPSNYSPNVSNIPAAPPTAFPSVFATTLATAGTATTSSVSPVVNLNPTIGTTQSTISGTAGGSTPLGTTRLADVGAITPMLMSALSTAVTAASRSPTTSGSGSSSSPWGTPTPTPVSVWGTTGTTSSGTNSLPTISVWGTTAAASMSPTVSVWGTSTPAPLATTGTSAQTPASPATGSTTTEKTSSLPSTTIHLSDSGAATPGLIVAVKPLPVTEDPLVTDAAIATSAEANEGTESPMGEMSPSGPETFTLSDFWYLTATTAKSPLVVASSPDSFTLGTTPTTSPESAATSAGTVPPTHAMITGPLLGFLNLPTVTMAPPPPPVSSSVVPSSSATSQVSHTSEASVSTSSTASSVSISLTSTVPQHVAAVPSYSIVGGPLSSYTNPPVIEALIVTSNSSAPVSTQTQSSQPAIRDVVYPSSTTTDVINNNFGGSDQSSVSSSSTASSEGVTTTTARPLGGLVGSVINSTGDFFNDTKAFLGNSVSDANSSSPVATFIISTGSFIDETLNSNTSFINNTKNWIDDKWDSTGEFLSNAWNSLSPSGNETSGTFLNSTKTWIGDAVNSTGEFLTNAWNGTQIESGNFVNTSKTWINEKLNGTAVGSFLNSTGGAIAGNVTSAVGGLIVDAKELIGGESNATSYAAAPLSNAVGSVASAILAPVNTSTADPPNVKTVWNGGVVSGPLNG
ncbi:unnamed protein product [Caenorhabditis sp. 36 PRJEB53466]|nr:unnamed protein product [Caenorhabditis sp. 36 PRJEB53466]